MIKMSVLAACVALVGCNTMPQTVRAPIYASAPTQVSGFALKEFEIGAPMATCPAHTIAQGESGGMIICTLGATTLANQVVTGHGIYLYEGKLAGASYTMKDRGQYANRAVLDALVEKFGAPLQHKSHINEAQWRRAGQVLVFKGWQGDVGMMDQEASRRAAAASAAKNKSDL